MATLRSEANGDEPVVEVSAAPDAALAFERMRHEELKGAFTAELAMLRKSLAARLKALRAAMDADLKDLARRAGTMDASKELQHAELEDTNRLLLRATEELATFRAGEAGDLAEFVRLSRRLAKLSRTLRKRAAR